MASQTAEALARLEEIRLEMSVEAKKLSEIHSERESLVSQNESLRNKNLSLSQELHKKESDLVELQSEFNQTVETHGLLRSQVRDLEEFFQKTLKTKNKHESDIEKKLTELASIEAQTVKSNEERVGIDSLLIKKREEYRSLLGEYGALGQQLSQAQNDVQTLSAKKHQIVSAIEAAIENFRIFERRIGRLSEETGYMIGYEDPIKLLENNE